MKQKIKLKVKQATVKGKVKVKNPWQVHLKKTYIKMQVKDKSAKFSDAMKAAKKTYTCKKK